MTQEFKNWLIKKGNNGAAQSYPGAINRLSNHYSKNTGENITSGSLLAVELKTGIADFRGFGQIAMYLGLLKKQFPDR